MWGTDKILIESYLNQRKARQQSAWDAVGDGISIVGDFLAIAADWGNDWQDVIFTALTSLLPHALALIVDITKATGNKPPQWLSDFVGYTKVAVNFLNGIRTVLRWLDPQAGFLGVIKSWIIHETKQALREGIGLAVSTIAAPVISSGSNAILNDIYNSTNSQIDALSNDGARQECNVVYAGDSSVRCL
ncbi:hypothetical protein [Dictyobacter kobayashii]|uniref:hypothetical protein n=1 Tax=Dictyobacter kobayashii TaxID=2014872 RepID=UPI000F83C838|nr:hypothetical protein [Dictyobacter kobayashii]